MPINYLYKYGKINEHSESIFVNSQLWHSTPAGLNDPFECRPVIDITSSEGDQIDRIKQRLVRENPQMRENEAEFQARQWYEQVGSKRKLNTEQFRADLLSMVNSNIGILSLSESYSNILMWSHYAADHTGYCIKFEASSFTPFFGDAQKVVYSDNYPTFNAFRTSMDRQIQLLLLTKYSGWKPEKEWRRIDTDNGSGLRSFSPKLMAGVIFGIRMVNSDKEKLYSWRKQRGVPLNFYQASQSKSKFAIDIHEVN